jgi:hypothetical protein
MAAVANGHRRKLCGRFLCRDWRRRRPGIGSKAQQSPIEIDREDRTFEASAQSKELTTEKLAMSPSTSSERACKSKMIAGPPSFPITTNLLSLRETGGDWNACFGTHRRASRDREKNVAERLNALGVIRIDVVMDVSDNSNETIHEK